MSRRTCAFFVCFSFCFIRETETATKTDYLGCYKDGGPSNRLLQGLQENFYDTLTPEKCNENCFEKGFSYAGTQYSYECFCSRTKPSDDKKTADGECDSKCAGDDSKTCGGTNRLSVFSTGIPETQIEDGLKYIGCFKDFSNGSRLMTGHYQVLADSLTNQLCITVCKRKGFHYAGMEYGSECFCDSKKPSFKQYAKDEDCSSRCKGNYLQTCGGYWKLSIFETGISDSPLPTNDGNYLGCYEDKESPRMLSGYVENFGKGLTSLKCNGLCYSMGFLYSGTQYSYQCYCGDEHPNPNSKVAEEECNKPCSGNPADKCGGNYRNSIRETGISDIPVIDKYLGCFNDQHNKVLKGVKETFDKTNSPRRCLNFCWQLGFRYSGVEYGKECFCGNEEPSEDLVVGGEECNAPCSGDPLESCGSNWRLAVYATNFTVSVVPLIHSTTKPCITSDTTVSGKQPCKGEVVFEDLFNSPLGNKWKHVVMIADAPDYEFAVFLPEPKNSFTSKNRLVIKPTYYDDTHTLTGLLDLKGCTATRGTRQCGYQAFSFNILPPVASARINTHDSFTFRYGIIEVRAKMPLGDWLVPELWLEPKSHHYGPDYASGRMRIAMSRGNTNLKWNGDDLGCNRLEPGVVMGPKENVRIRSIPTNLPANWHDHFHNYTLVWTPDQISFKIDNEHADDLIPAGRRLCEVIGFGSEECLTWSSGSKIAPFDQEFYISFGLSVGNVRDFPDECINGGQPKPWKNLELKAMLKFWQDRNNWKATWTDEKSALYIEHVRVTAL